MPPAKRARPSFSPPRPGKTKSTKTPATKKTTATRPTSTNKHAGRKGTRGALLSSDDDNDSTMNDDDDDNDETHRAPNPRAFIDDEASAHEDEEDLNSLDDLPSRSRSRANPTDPADDSEPDLILAEVINHPAPNDAVIPEKLVHKLLQYHLKETGSEDEKTRIKISKDARELVTKYIDVFVREAIMRSTFERHEQEKAGGGGGGGVSTGFLEVEDLERAAAQLCLDF